MESARLSSLLFSPQCHACAQARLPCTSSASFRVAMVACRRLRPSPVANPVPRLPPFILSQSRLRPSRPRPSLFSPVSLTCQHLHPGPPAIFYHYHRQEKYCTFLVAVNSLSSARMSQVLRSKQARESQVKSSCQALSLAWPTHPRASTA